MRWAARTFFCVIFILFSLVAVDFLNAASGLNRGQTGGSNLLAQEVHELAFTGLTQPAKRSWWARHKKKVLTLLAVAVGVAVTTGAIIVYKKSINTAALPAAKGGALQEQKGLDMVVQQQVLQEQQERKEIMFQCNPNFLSIFRSMKQEELEGNVVLPLKERFNDLDYKEKELLWQVYVFFMNKHKQACLHILLAYHLYQEVGPRSPIEVNFSPVYHYMGEHNLANLQRDFENEGWVKHLENECLLCVKEIGTEKMLFAILPCRHSVCRKCEGQIQKRLQEGELQKKQCPFCNQPYESVSLITVQQ